MSNRTSEELRLLEKAGRYLPGGNTGNLHFNPEQDFLVAGGKGSRVWDVSGNEYVDWLMGSGPMLLGHAHPHVVEAVIKTVEQGSTFFANNDKAVMLAEALVETVPCADKARFTTSGTDACFQAMRIARAFTGKEKVLKFEGGYHGSQRLRFDERHAQRLPGIPAVGSQQRRHPQGHRRPDAHRPLQRPVHHRSHHTSPPRRVGGGHRGAVATHHHSPSGLPPGPARHHRPLRHSPDFRRGRNQLPPGLRRSAGILRGDARSLLSRQDNGRAATRWPPCWAAPTSCRSTTAARWTATPSSVR